MGLNLYEPSFKHEGLGHESQVIRHGHRRLGQGAGVSSLASMDLGLGAGDLSGRVGYSSIVIATRTRALES